MKKQGFSLVELLIVIAILALLAAIAIPQFQIFQMRSKRTDVILYLSTIYQTELTYYSGEDTFIVSGSVNQINQRLGIPNQTRFGYGVDVGMGYLGATPLVDNKNPGFLVYATGDLLANRGLGIFDYDTWVVHYNFQSGGTPLKIRNREPFLHIDELFVKMNSLW